MSYSFWETVRGVELAETLIHTLPKIADQQNKDSELLEKIKLLRQSVDELKEEIRSREK